MLRRGHHPHAQLRFDMEHAPQPDRNAHRGGRSIYLFDLDDNVLFLSTTISLFSRVNDTEITLSTAEFSRIQPQIGKQGRFEHAEVRLCDRTGSFRRFRDSPDLAVGDPGQTFPTDIRAAIEASDFAFKGPSWDLFYHAVHNRRPLSIITARGHHPATIKQGITHLVEAGHLTHEPHYLTILPVTHPATRRELLDDAELNASVPELKKRAIRKTVLEAIHVFGSNPHHRFGMSDDDTHNVALVTEAMLDLKREFPDNAFFVFDTSKHTVNGEEVFLATEVPKRNAAQLAFEFLG